MAAIAMRQVEAAEVPGFLNDPGQWKENIPCPDTQALISVNQALAGIGGTETDGTPHYRAVWGQDVVNAKIRDRFRGRWIPRYLYLIRTWYEEKLNPATGIWETPELTGMVATPRFFIEAFIPPSIARSSGTSAGVDADGDRYEAHDPINGDWITMWMVNVHDEHKRCCAQADEAKQNCFGWYRPPGQQDVEMVRELWQRRQQEVNGLQLSERATPAQMDSVTTQAIKADRERLEKLKQDTYVTTSFMRTHGHRITTDPAVLAHGKFRFMGSNSTIDGKPVRVKEKA